MNKNTSIAVYGILRRKHTTGKNLLEKHRTSIKKVSPCVINDVERHETSFAYCKKGKQCLRSELIEFNSIEDKARVLPVFDRIEGHPYNWHRVNCTVTMEDGSIINTEFYEAPKW